VKLHGWSGIDNLKMIRLSKSCLGELEKKAVMEVLDKGFLGMGAEVQEFERELTSFFGRPTVCVSSGTAALHIALQAIGLSSGDEVLVQSLTYVASFQAISASGATPVACDILTDTLCIDLEDAERKLTKNTKAIMPVHYSGGVGDLEKVYAFADKHNLRVVEDAAHALGTNYIGRKVGGFGDVVCFSFDGIKNITSGEGGCIVSDDQSLLKSLRDIRLLGVEKDTEKRYSGTRSWSFNVIEQGWRYHMSNIMAAIGIVQLSRIGEFKSNRQKICKKYVEELGGINEVDFLDVDFDLIMPHIFVIKVQKRDELKKHLISNNIECGVHYQPNHLLSKYASKNALPKTEKIFGEILTLPCHSSLTFSEQDIVINNIRKFYE